MRKRISKGLRQFAERVEKHHRQPDPEPTDGLREFEVVVSGSPFNVRANPNEKVHSLIRAAMKKALVTKEDYPDIAGWTLRPQEGGREIAPGHLIADLPSETLFLDPDEGGGGNVQQGAVEAVPTC